MKQSVRWNDIVECFRSALCIDSSPYIRKGSEQVKTIKHDGHISVHEFLRHSGVPHKLIRIHETFAVASARIHRDVSRELDAVRQFQSGIGFIMISEHIQKTKKKASKGAFLKIV